MKEGRTPEVELRRIQSTKDAYASMTEIDKQKFSDHAKALWESGAMDGVAEKQSKTFKERFAAGEYDFAERNKKISQKISQLYIEGGFQWSKDEYTSTKTGRTIYHRSSWERMYAEKLDGDDSVETWDYEFIAIPYQLDGMDKLYIPDFYVKMKNGLEKLVEIKPMSLRTTMMNISKRKAAELFCASKGWMYEEHDFEE